MADSIKIQYHLPNGIYTAIIDEYYEDYDLFAEKYNVLKKVSQIHSGRISKKWFVADEYRGEIVEREGDILHIVGYDDDIKTTFKLVEDTIIAHGDSYYDGLFAGSYIDGIPIGRHTQIHDDKIEGYTIYDDGIPIEFDRVMIRDNEIVGRETYTN